MTPQTPDTDATPLDPKQEAVDLAACQLLIEIAFLVPKGTDLREHPIARKLEDYKRAIQERERALLASPATQTVRESVPSLPADTQEK